MVRIDQAQVQAYLRGLPPYAGCRGSIVRLRVTDFMTYHSAELRPGANVNVILGPNGTGKSTIVCALCIGLGGKAKILGRASVLKEFIRHEAKSATIEIELYNPDGFNYVIKRHISETSKGTVSKWYLQNKKVKQPKIEELTASLNIQLDNLCQFLPQDRVQDFVVMDSASLLQNTQKALGNDTLYQRHEHLIQLTGKLQDVDRNLRSHMTQLKSVQQYTKRLEKDVENYRDRENLKNKIADLTSKKAWIVYLKTREIFSSLKTELEAATKSKKQEEAKLAPLKKSLELLESRSAKLQVDLDRLRAQNNSLINSMKRKVEEEFDRVETNIGEEQAKFNEQERSEKDRLKRVENVNFMIGNYEKQLEEIRMKGDMDDTRLKGELSVLDKQIRKLDDQILEINGHDERDESERRYLLTRIRTAENDLSRIDDLRVSRLKYLEREQPDVYDAVMFFSKPENKAKFKGRIHEPMVLHISINDLRYGRVAEKHIGYSELNSFFCEHKDDLEVMLEMNEKRKKRVSVTHYQGPRHAPFQKPKCMYSDSFMNDWGFIKVLLELIEGPDYYLGYLYERLHLEKVLLGSTRTEERTQEIVDRTNLNLFYTEKSSYHIRQSNYCKSKALIYNGLPNPRVMTTEINANEKQRLLESVNEMRSDEKRIVDKISGRASRKVELEEERQTAEDKIRDINARIEYRKNLQQKLEKAKRQLAAYERERRDMESLKSEYEQAVMRHRLKLTSVCDFLKREIPKIETNGALPIVIRRSMSLIQTRKMSRRNELEQMQTEVKECEAKIRTLTPQVEQSAKEAETNKKEAISKSSNQTEPPQDVVNGELSEKDVDKELNQANVQLRFLLETDPSIVRDYQEKMRKISDLQQQKEHGEKQLSDIKDEIQKEKEAWLNPLTDLIGTVNKNFGRFFANMGCAGEVVLHKGPDENDFSKYGIKILVKFRSSEPLSELGGNKGLSLQSGGEKVISTALYILALQELTTVPFRVIDEINQGMDATNEARFFNLLCTLAKGKNTPQYFLLSPKMLPTVDYPDNVEFHVIMSGPHVNVPITAHTSADSSDEDGGEED